MNVKLKPLLQIHNPITITLRCEVPAKPGVHERHVREYDVVIDDDFYTNSWLLSQAMKMYMDAHDDEHPDFTRVFHENGKELDLEADCLDDLKDGETVIARTAEAYGDWVLAVRGQGAAAEAVIDDNMAPAGSQGGGSSGGGGSGGGGGGRSGGSGSGGVRADADTESRRLAAELATLFKRWDIDRSGSLDIDEMQRVLLHVEVDLHRHELAAVVARVKGLRTEELTDKDYQISASEFSAFFGALAEGDPPELIHDTIRKLTMSTLFMRIDTNKNGYLEIDELLDALLKVEIHLLDSEIEEVLRKVKGLPLDDEALPPSQRRIVDNEFPRFFIELCSGDDPDLVQDTIDKLFAALV
eukprot:g1229.t1